MIHQLFTANLSNSHFLVLIPFPRINLRHQTPSLAEKHLLAARKLQERCGQAQLDVCFSSNPHQTLLQLPKSRPPPRRITGWPATISPRRPIPWRIKMNDRYPFLSLPCVAFYARRSQQSFVQRCDNPTEKLSAQISRLKINVRLIVVSW